MNTQTVIHSYNVNITCNLDESQTEKKKPQKVYTIILYVTF